MPEDNPELPINTRWTRQGFRQVNAKYPVEHVEYATTSTRMVMGMNMVTRVENGDLGLIGFLSSFRTVFPLDPYAIEDLLTSAKENHAVKLTKDSERLVADALHIRAMNRERRARIVIAEDQYRKGMTDAAEKGFAMDYAMGHVLKAAFDFCVMEIAGPLPNLRSVHEGFFESLASAAEEEEA